MFLVLTRYIRPLPEIEARTAEHRAWLDEQIAAGVLILTGPQVPRTGGVLIASAGRTREALEAILAQDPFSLHGLADFEIIEFAAGKFAPALADLV